jgi:hypothetical protein
MTTDAEETAGTITGATMTAGIIKGHAAIIS